MCFFFKIGSQTLAKSNIMYVFAGRCLRAWILAIPCSPPKPWPLCNLSWFLFVHPSRGWCPCCPVLRGCCAPFRGVKARRMPVKSQKSSSTAKGASRLVSSTQRHPQVNSFSLVVFLPLLLPRCSRWMRVMYNVGPGDGHTNVEHTMNRLKKKTMNSRKKWWGMIRIGRLFFWCRRNVLVE